MYAREFNEFWNFANVQSDDDFMLSIQQRMDYWKQFQTEILPAVVNANSGAQKRRQTGLNKAKKIIQPVKVGTQVMAIDQTRANKWDPVYEGPFVVKERHARGLTLWWTQCNSHCQDNTL